MAANLASAYNWASVPLYLQSLDTCKCDQLSDIRAVCCHAVVGDLQLQTACTDTEWESALFEDASKRYCIGVCTNSPYHFG